MAGLPRNIVVADLVEVMEAKAAAGIGGMAAEREEHEEEDGGVVCDLCDDGEKKPAAIHCPTCGDFLCDSHQRAHAKAGIGKTHAVLTMEEYTKGAAGDGGYWWYNFYFYFHAPYRSIDNLRVTFPFQYEIFLPEKQLQDRTRINKKIYFLSKH